MEARIVFVAIVAVVIVLSLFLTYIFSQPKVDINAEIAKLNLDQATIQVITNGECKNLEKSESFWIFKNCKGDYYFKLFFNENGYVLGYCTSWNTPREAVLKLREFVGDCRELDANDEEKMRLGGQVWYSICGRDFIFLEECIIGR